MSTLYISDAKTKVGIEENRLTAVYEDGVKQSIPIETVDSITLLARAQISSACMIECLRRGIPVIFMSKGGKYFGRLTSLNHTKAKLQRKQSALYDTDFALEFSKRIIMGKTKNQLVVLKRYAKSRQIDYTEFRIKMSQFIGGIIPSKSIQELMGYEGGAAKVYFDGLSKCIEADFAFNGRSRRPPKDPFNSLISLGYSILLNEIVSKIESKGLNSYFGFMHRDAEKHPTLASDLLEEWRAVIVDSIALSLINGHEIRKEHFRQFEDESGGCFLTKEGMKIFLKKFETKLQTKTKYLNYVSYAVNFRRAIDLQIERLVDAINEGDAKLYEPIFIR